MIDKSSIKDRSGKCFYEGAITEPCELGDQGHSLTEEQLKKVRRVLGDGLSLGHDYVNTQFLQSASFYSWEASSLLKKMTEVFFAGGISSGALPTLSESPFWQDAGRFFIPLTPDFDKVVSCFDALPPLWETKGAFVKGCLKKDFISQNSLLKKWAKTAISPLEPFPQSVSAFTDGGMQVVLETSEKGGTAYSLSEPKNQALKECVEKICRLDLGLNREEDGKGLPHSRGSMGTPSFF